MRWSIGEDTEMTRMQDDEGIRAGILRLDAGSEMVAVNHGICTSHLIVTCNAHSFLSDLHVYNPCFDFTMTAQSA
jgi:hypothetical protein